MSSSSDDKGERKTNEARCSSDNDVDNDVEVEEDSDYDYSNDDEEEEEDQKERYDNGEAPFYGEFVHVQEEVKLALSWAVSISVLLFAILYYSFLTFVIVLSIVVTCNNVDCGQYYRNLSYKPNRSSLSIDSNDHYRRYFTWCGKFASLCCIYFANAILQCKNALTFVIYYVYKSKPSASPSSSNDPKTR